MTRSNWQLLVTTTTILLLFSLTLVQSKSLDDSETDSETGSLREMRKLLLTKDNIEEHLARKQKDILVQNIPAPLDISTSIDFSSASDEPGNHYIPTYLSFTFGPYVRTYCLDIISILDKFALNVVSRWLHFWRFVLLPVANLLNILRL